MTATALLLDVEGTTTPISFVTEVLFPYAAAEIPGFLVTHATDPEVAAACALTAADAQDSETALAGLDRILAVVRRQMAGDVKAKGLKTLQGLVWNHGYRSGAIQGRVFADVPLAFRRWRDEGRPVAIYSSGSVLAQKLIFGFSEAGDLTPFITAHYDTAVGSKREAASYAAIATAWGRPTDHILFLTDQPAEAQAAAAAGMQTALLMRPGNAPIPAGLGFAVHRDFQGL